MGAPPYCGVYALGLRISLGADCRGVPVELNGMAQRADIVAMGSDCKPLVVVECKEPNVKIDRTVLNQVVRYNSVIGARYIVMSNGIDTFCYEYNGKSYTPQCSFPQNDQR